MPEVLLKAENLSHSYDYLLYSYISLTLKECDSFAVMGRSGSGKSTLLYSLSGFLPPKKGKVEIFGKDIYQMDKNDIETLRRYEIGMIFQSHYLFKGMTGIENIEVATLLSGRDIDRDIFKALEIEDVMDHKVSELSGGQQQRVSIARVLSKKPRLIFADEPTGNLDRETSILVMEALKRYTKENSSTLFLVTHDEKLAKMCDKIYVLKDKSLFQKR
jgi:putative ABC transport system ATP-binding protein